MQSREMTAENRTDSQRSRPRVLVIDPDSGTAIESARRLFAAGFVATAAPSAERALQLVTETTFDAILCEIRLPRMGGFALREALLCDPATAHVRFSFIAANPRLEDHATALRLGAGILSKPVELAALRAQSAAARLVVTPPDPEPHRPVGEPEFNFVRANSASRTIFRCSSCDSPYDLGEELADDRLLATCPRCLARRAS